MQVRRLLLLGLPLVVTLWAFGAAADSQFFKAELFGAYVVGDRDGDGNGFGGASLLAESDGRLVTIHYVIQVQRLAQPTAMDIHHGGPGQNGLIVATLKTPPDGAFGSASDGVITLPVDWGLRLFRGPNNFYVDVHTTQFPNGALRGQLD